MKNFQQNLLIVLALGLCALCAYQWYGQTLQRGQMDNLGLLLSQKLAAIQDYTNSIRTLDEQLARMDARITELKGTIKTNDQLFLTQKRQLNQFEADNASLAGQIKDYKQAIEKFQAWQQQANDGIKKQNEAIKELTAQRDEFVQKLNASVKERNDIVGKYNDLVTRFEKLQGDVKTPAK